MGKPNTQYPHALPFYSAPDEKHAMSLIILCCSRSYDSERYGIPGFGGELPDIKTATALFTERDTILRNRRGM